MKIGIFDRKKSREVKLRNTLNRLAYAFYANDGTSTRSEGTIQNVVRLLVVYVKNEIGKRL